MKLGLLCDRQLSLGNNSGQAQFMAAEMMLAGYKFSNPENFPFAVVVPGDIPGSLLDQLNACVREFDVRTMLSKRRNNDSF